MRKILVLALLFGFFNLTGLRAESVDDGVVEAKPLGYKDASQEMAEVWCAKMEECAPEKSMSVKECRKILFKSFKSGFDRLPKEQPLRLERPGFDQCKTNVAQGTCEGLKTARTLPGCEFISLLGQ